LRNLRRARDASRDGESTLVNIIVQLPVSNNIAELPGLAPVGTNRLGEIRARRGVADRAAID